MSSQEARVTFYFRCEFCGKQSASIKRCGRCKVKGYCSSSCQAKDWSQHKSECEVLRNAIKSKTDEIDGSTTARKIHYRALRLLHKRQFREARVELLKALKLDATNYKLWSNLGSTCLALGHFNALAVAAKTCIKYAPQLTYIHTYVLDAYICMHSTHTIFRPLPLYQMPRLRISNARCGTV